MKAIAAGEKVCNLARLTSGDFRFKKIPDVHCSPSRCYGRAPGLGQGKAASPAVPGPARLEHLIEANIVAVHAYQILLARKQPNADPACWAAKDLKETQLEALVAHQASLLSSPAAARAWALGDPSALDPKKDLQPLLAADLPMPANLPVNTFTAYLRDRAPHHRNEEIRSVANLYQTVLEVERDGDRLQDLYAFYIALGLPVYIAQLGLPSSDEDFLATGRLLEGRACSSPVGLSAAEWQIAGRKIWNWGEKNLHVHDAQVLGDELLDEPDVKVLEPKMKALRAQRIAVIGHSFTMDLHWASPSAFVPIVTAMFARKNPGVQFRQFQGGGFNLVARVQEFLSGCARMAAKHGASGRHQPDGTRPCRPTHHGSRSQGRRGAGRVVRRCA